MTLLQVIVSICKKEFSAGLLYTGCSRVTDITGLAILGYDETANCFPKIQRWVYTSGTLAWQCLILCLLGFWTWESSSPARSEMLRTVARRHCGSKLRPDCRGSWAMTRMMQWRLTKLTWKEMHLEYVTACNNKCKWRIKIFTVLHFFYQLLVNQNDHLGTYWCSILHTGWRFRVGRWQVSLSLKPCQRKSETPACGASSVRFGQLCGPTDLRLRFSWLAGVGLILGWCNSDTLIVGLSLTRQS